MNFINAKEGNEMRVRKPAEIFEMRRSTKDEMN